MANRLAVAVTACVCALLSVCVYVWKTEIYCVHIAGLRSKRLYKSFVLLYPLIVQLHPYGVSVWPKYGSHDSKFVALYACQVKHMCGRSAVRGQSALKQSEICRDQY